MALNTRVPKKGRAPPRPKKNTSQAQPFFCQLDHISTRNQGVSPNVSATTVQECASREKNPDRLAVRLHCHCMDHTASQLMPKKRAKKSNSNLNAQY